MATDALLLMRAQALPILASAARRVTFEDLVRGHQDEVYGLALRILGDRDTALEVANTTFLKAYRAFDRYDPARTLRHCSCGSRRTRRSPPAVASRATARGPPAGTPRSRSPTRARARSPSPSDARTPQPSARRSWHCPSSTACRSSSGTSTISPSTT